jgi:hypothetical protein
LLLFETISRRAKRAGKSFSNRSLIGRVTPPCPLPEFIRSGLSQRSTLNPQPSTDLSSASANGAMSSASRSRGNISDIANEIYRNSTGWFTRAVWRQIREMVKAVYSFCGRNFPYYWFG